MRTLTRSDLINILYGSALLGSGGGGSISTGKQFIEIILAHKKRVVLIDKPRVGIGCVLADIGAITAIENNQAKAIYNAFERLDEYVKKIKGKKISCIFPVETGPENTFAPMVLAAQKGIPVFDGDGAGRAVPEIQLCSFASAGIKPSPAAITNDLTDALIVFCNDPGGMDKLLRPVTGAEQFGNSASLAFFPAETRRLAAAAVQGSISFSMYTGMLLQQLFERRKTISTTVRSIVNKRNACLLAEGKVMTVNDQLEGAFNVGSVIVKNIGGGHVTIYTQNENLIAYSDKQPYPLAVAPHSICYLKKDGKAVTNSEIKVGDHIFVICVHAAKQLMKPHVLTGFLNVLATLGFAGTPGYSDNHGKWQPLGDLLISLKYKSKNPRQK
jgi:DUF917 family protein